MNTFFWGILYAYLFLIDIFFICGLTLSKVLSEI